jgi:LuxR family transcriptional regulator, maltose regulon positive regulatory protein
MGDEGFDDPLLAIRFAIPDPPRVYVHRPRLKDLLDRGADLPLTLVSAPAGSGKTAIVAAWAAKRAAAGSTVAWVTFEEREAPAGAFWSYVQEALHRQGVAVPGVRFDAAAEYSRLLTEIAGALAARTQPVTLVLDSYELATAEESRDLDFLLRHSGQKLHVVMMTRADPVLPLHRYRLADMMAEVRMADLAFTENETAQLVAQSGIDLSDDSIDALTRRTRGWAAGLRFASMYLQRSEDPDAAVAQLAGDTGNIAEYLMAEVLQTQSPEVRSLLLRTSVVDVLQPGLVEELAGRSASRLLASLAGGNVLVEPVANHPGWYRYHPFLRDLLRAELEHQSPARRVKQHLKAANWFARNGLLGPAVGLAAAVDAWRDASAYIVDALAIGEVLLANDPTGLDHELSKMPPDVADPAASVVRAALALVDQDTDRCAAELSRVAGMVFPESAHDRAVGLAADVVQTVRLSLLDDPGTAAHADVVQQELAMQERDKVVAHPELTALVQASKGRALLRDGDLIGAREAFAAAADTQAPGCETLIVPCLGYLALIDSHQGMLNQAEDRAALAGALSERSGLPPGSCPAEAQIALARVSSERFDLRASRKHLRAAMQSYAVPSDPVPQAFSAVVQARLLRIHGELDVAGDLIDSVAAQPEVSESWLFETLRTEAAMLMVARDEPDAAVRAIEELGDPDEPNRALVLGHAYLAQEDWDSVEHAVSVILAQGNESSLQAAVGARVLEVACELHRGQPGLARIALGRALRMAAPEGLRAPFRQAPAVVRRLLETDTELAERNTWLGPVVSSRRKVLTRPATRPSAGVIESDAVHEGGVRNDGRFDTYIEPLTAKETEVLGLLSELLSTEEIAAVMFVSVNTVRTHIRNILRKLAVSRRNEAVRRARALSLIPA